MTREGQTQDLLNCRGLQRVFGSFSFRTNGNVLGGLWRTLLSEGALRLSVVENRAQSGASPIIAFSAALFVTQRFHVEAQSTLPPSLGRQIVQRCLTGASPTLNRKAVARANAQEGLCVIVCSAAFGGEGVSVRQELITREKQSDALQFALDGYQIKDLLVDITGAADLRWMLNAGLHIRRDYCGYFQSYSLPVPDAASRPWLVGVTRTEALAQAGARITGLFLHSRPRFHFSESEQILLRRALTGKTGENLAESLFISPWTVKKRWQAIYARVAEIDGELLPPPVSNGRNKPCRGTERKRHLLNYIQQHREELAPYSWSAAHQVRGEN
jgi:DNA-binding CsgD family transcriptional regulator